HIHVPKPREETLSRHSFVQSSCHQGIWEPSLSHTRVEYPGNNDICLIEIPSLERVEEYTLSPGNFGNLDFGAKPAQANVSSPLSTVDSSGSDIHVHIVRQPTPSPVLSCLQSVPAGHNAHAHVTSSSVVDPRLGSVKSFQDDLSQSTSLQHVQISPKMMEDFLKLAKPNTEKNLETCGILAGSLISSGGVTVPYNERRGDIRYPGRTFSFPAWMDSCIVDIIKNSRGQYCNAYAHFIGIHTNNFTELIACQHGIALTRSFHILQLIMEGDSRLIIDMINQGSTLHKDPTLTSVDAVHKEGLEGRGFSNPHDEFLGFNSHTHAGEKSNLHFERDGTTKEEELALTPIIVPKSQHDEIIIDHCLVMVDNISICDESMVEKEAKGMVGTHFSKRHDDSQLAGLFITEAPSSQVEGFYGFGKNHNEAPCMCQQSMDEVKVGKLRTAKGGGGSIFASLILQSRICGKTDFGMFFTIIAVGRKTSMFALYTSQSASALFTLP
ncbi:hypothetical protein KI387_002170, partial [Taxus chinensis]